MGSCQGDVMVGCRWLGCRSQVCLLEGVNHLGGFGWRKPRVTSCTAVFPYLTHLPTACPEGLMCWQYSPRIMVIGSPQGPSHHQGTPHGIQLEEVNETLAMPVIPNDLDQQQQPSIAMKSAIQW